jgi:hypothetical protein
MIAGSPKGRMVVVMPDKQAPARLRVRLSG